MYFQNWYHKLYLLIPIYLISTSEKVFTPAVTVVLLLMASVLLGSQGKAGCVTRASMTEEVKGCHYSCLSPTLLKKIPANLSIQLYSH